MNQITTLDTVYVNGEKYDIKMRYDGANYEVFACNSDNEIYGISYIITWANAETFKEISNEDIKQKMVDMLKKDIANRRYEEFLEVQKMFNTKIEIHTK